MLQCIMDITQRRNRGDHFVEFQFKEDCRLPGRVQTDHQNTNGGPR